MSDALCPNCKRPVQKTRPVRVPTDSDSHIQWKGHTPDVVGFACTSCGVLVPLTALARNDPEMR